MKHIFYFSFALILFSCGPKTAETSKYSNYISELSELYSSVDSSYTVFSKIDNDSLKNISNEANKKHSKVKSVYRIDTVDSNYEVIMLTARGAIYKKIKKYLKDYGTVEKEYDYTTKQYNILRERLIHEKMDESDAHNYTNEEKNAMILLNGEMKELTEIAKLTFSSYENIFSKMDSIIEFHEEK